MSTPEENKKLLYKFYDLLQKQDYEAMRPFVHEDFTFYTQVDTPNYGIDGFREAEKKAFDAYPDFQFPVHDIVAEGDTAMEYLTFSGTHTGIPYCGLAPTGKHLKVSIMMKLKFKDGKLSELRAHYDRFDQMIQLGVDMPKLIGDYSKEVYGK